MDTLSGLLSKENITTDNTYPGVPPEEWRSFCDAIDEEIANNPKLSTQKCVRKALSKTQEEGKCIILRINQAHTYIKHLREVGVLKKKFQGKKIYSTPEGITYEYMNREQVMEFFDASMRPILIDAIRKHHGLFRGYEIFADEQNKLLIKGMNNSHIFLLPKTYSTLISIVIGSTETLATSTLTHIGFTQEQINFILTPERSRRIATKEELLSGAVREHITLGLIRGKKSGGEFRSVLTDAIQSWNIIYGKIYGYYIPLQINPYKAGTSLCNIFEISDASWRSILKAWDIDVSVWKNGDVGNTILDIKSQVLSIIGDFPFFRGKPNDFRGKSSIQIEDFEVIHGVFRLNRSGLEKFGGKYDADEIQHVIDALLGSADN